MKLCLCVLYTALQVTVGCIISEPKYENITRSLGESVLLPCSCTDLQTKPDEIEWTGPRENKKKLYKLTGNLKVKKHYSGRVQTFSDSSPGNASLLLSNLTEEDQGEYTCEIESNKTERSRVITLIIKGEEPGDGCIISEPEYETITRSPGEFVLLSCSCTDLQTTPDGIQWSGPGKNKNESYKLTGDLNEEVKNRYSGRVRTFSNRSPGNASLLLTDLTEEDQGNYSCDIKRNERKEIRVITLIIKRCIISEPEEETITRSPGESVLLSCSCTDLQTKPDKIEWSVIDKKGLYKLTGDLETEDKKRYSGRVQTFSDISPGNASLLLSNLTEEDEGEYTCLFTNKHGGMRTINLIFEREGEGAGAGDTEAEAGVGLPSIVLILILLVGMLGTAAVLYWRYTKRRNEPSDSRGEHSGQEQQRDEDVTYSTVVYENTARAAPRDANTEETTEYASVRADGDVTYSTVDHGNRARPPPKEINTEENTEYSSIRLDRV